MGKRHARRLNMAERASETWRPPLFASRRGRLHRLLAVIRRWFDLQAGSVWRDLAVELADVSGRVVDVGCGAQPYRGLLPLGTQYQGIDTCDAKDHFGYEVPDTLIYSGNIWPIADCSADVVLATETLEHVPDPMLFLQETHRCLRPGGRLIATVPFAARWHFIPHDYWRFTPSGLERLLKAAGFEDVVVYARGNAVTVACYKMMALVLPLLMPQDVGAMKNILMRVLGVCLLPLFVVAAFIGNLSLRGDGGDDCLGHTVLAKRENSNSAVFPMRSV